MPPYLLTLSLIILFFSPKEILVGQSPVGIWRTIDDVTGQAKSYVEWFKEGELYKARVVKLLLDPEDTLCEKCKGSLKNKPVKGMIICHGLKKNGDKYSGGSILDPETGKEYQCQIWLEGENRLVVRGYLGMSIIGRSQKWERVK